MGPVRAALSVEVVLVSPNVVSEGTEGRGVHSSAQKVAIVMPLAEQRGGGELMLVQLMKARPDPAVEWMVIFLEDGPMVRELQGLGLDARVVRAGRLRQPGRYLAAVAKIARLAAREKASLIVGWMPKANLYAGPAARLAGVPSVWYQLGIPASGHWLDRLTTRLPTRGVLAVSRYAAEAQARLRPARPIRVVYPGVDLERFRPGSLPAPAEARRRLGLPQTGPLIGIFGRLQRWKGIHVLVEALPAVLRSQPEANCVVVGGEHALEPGYRAYLEERIGALGLERRVLLAGLQQDVPQWMQAMDVVVHASDAEPFGIVIIEAMALEKPVVAGAAGGPAEIVTDGVTGLLRPYGDPDLLAAAILRYLDDPAFAEQVGQAARERALEFSIERYRQALLGALREFGLDSPAGSPPA